MGPRRFWNLPRSMITHMSGGQHLDMPTAWDTRTGILEPVTLVVAGPAYTTDVFCKPSVEDKRLGLEITLHNPGDRAATDPGRKRRSSRGTAARAARPKRRLPRKR